MNIFSPREQRVIARCQGHSPFLSALAFDDLRCDGRTYRFGSVGEDNKLILVIFFLKVSIDMALTCHDAVGLFERDAPPPQVTFSSPSPLHGLVALTRCPQAHGCVRCGPFNDPPPSTWRGRTTPSLPLSAVPQRGRDRSTGARKTARERHPHCGVVPPTVVTHWYEGRPREVVDSPTPSDVAEEWTCITYRH